MYKVIYNSVFSLRFSTEVETCTSYISPFRLVSGWVFSYIGVQMALPGLIISRIKKAARKEQLRLKVYAMLTSTIRPASLKELSECCVNLVLAD